MLLVVGATALMPAGIDAQALGVLVAGLWAIWAIRRGVLRHRPHDVRPWWLFAVASGAILVAAIFGELGGPVGRGLQLAFDGAGYLCGIAAATILVRRRRLVGSGRAVGLDALILVGAIGSAVWVLVLVPYVTADGRSLGEGAEMITFSLLSLALTVQVARLAIGPGVRNRSYYLLALTALTALAADVLTALAASRPDSLLFEQLLLAVPTVALASLGLSALDPSMVRVTEADPIAEPEMTRWRFVALAAATLTPPILLVVAEDEVRSLTTTVVVATWALLSLLVLARLIELLGRRGREAMLDKAHGDAVAGLVSATTPDELARAVFAGMDLIIGPDRGREAELLWSTDGGWAVLARDGSTRPAPTELLSAAGVTSPGRSTASADRRVIALRARNRVLGALITPALDGDDVATTVSELAVNVSLAIDGANVVEQRHRHRSEHRFRSLVEASHDLIAMVDDSGTIVYVAPNCAEIVGRTAEELIDRQLLDLVAPDDVVAVRQALSAQAPASGPIEARLPVRGEERTFELRVTDLRHDAAMGGFVLNAQDVTDRRRLEADLRHRALHDPLTGLANRALFEDRVTTALDAARRGGVEPTVVFVDLDDFKLVNDTLGHAAGDELLLRVAGRLESIIEPGETAARLVGDELALLVLRPAEEAVDLAADLVTAIGVIVDPAGQEVTVGASAGVATMTVDDVDAAQLLRDAATAMYAAKADGKGRVELFEAAMGEELHCRIQLRADLRLAIEHGELEVYFQPIVRLPTGAIHAVEALVRWVHPEQGVVRPDAFLEIAEETGLIVPLGEFVVQRAISVLAGVDDEHLRLNVNVSLSQLCAPGLIDLVDETLRRHGIARERLSMELTEGQNWTEEARERLQRFRDLGIGVSADDFGSGYASYSSLQQLPFTNVKVDRSVVNGLREADPAPARAQLRSILDMANEMGLTTTAEGIEDESMATTLWEIGYELAQGYHFSRPVPPEQLPALVQEFRAIAS